MALTLYDWRGTRIEVGDTILYAVKHSTYVEVNEAIVAVVDEVRKYEWSDEMQPGITVEWQRSNGGYPEWRKTKRVILRVIKNVTVLEKGPKVPGASRADLLT